MSRALDYAAKRDGPRFSKLAIIAFAFGLLPIAATAYLVGALWYDWKYPAMGWEGFSRGMWLLPTATLLYGSGTAFVSLILSAAALYRIRRRRHELCGGWAVKYAAAISLGWLFLAWSAVAVTKTIRAIYGT